MTRTTSCDYQQQVSHDVKLLKVTEVCSALDYSLLMWMLLLFNGGVNSTCSFLGSKTIWGVSHYIIDRLNVMHIQ